MVRGHKLSSTNGPCQRVPGVAENPLIGFNQFNLSGIGLRRATSSMEARPMASTKKKGKGIKFVKWFRHPKTGKIIRASDYGLKAFPIPIEK